MRLEDRLDELLLQSVEVGVHVGDRRGKGQVLFGVRLQSLPHQKMRLLPHPGDERTEIRVEWMSEDPPGNLAQVGHQIGRTLEFGRHLHDHNRMTQFARHRSVKSHQTDALLFEGDRAGVILVVSEDLILSTLHVLFEKNRRRPADAVDQRLTQIQGLET